MIVGTCPSCGTEVGLGEAPGLGTRHSCRACGAYLEVISLSPTSLDWAFDLPEGKLEYDVPIGDTADPL
jgi:lysine biosynthesis protein LysW